MKFDWLNKLVFGETSYGLELVVKSDNSIDYYLVKSAIQKGELEILEKEKGSSLEELINYNWNKDLAVFLSVRGKGILQKKIIQEEGDEEYSLVRKALPNAKVDEFYFDVQPITEDNCWLSLVRKTQIDELLENLKQAGLHFVGIDLGFIGVGNLSELIELDEIKVDEYKLSLNKNGLNDIQSSAELENERIRIGGEYIESHWLAAFAASINFHKNEYNFIGNEYLSAEKEEFRQHKFFKLGVKTALGFFLLLLLANFMLFQNYNKRHASLSEKLAVNSTLLNRVDDLREEFKRNELFFKSTDLISSSKSSFYADRLAESKPSGIFWNKLDLNPAVRKIKKSEDVEFQIGKINIEGVSSKSELLNNWIKILESQDWISSIDIKDYKDLEKRKGGSFFIQIHLK